MTRQDANHADCADRPLDVQISGQKELYKGFREYRGYDLTHASIGRKDTLIGPMNRELVMTGRVSAVLLFDPEKDRLVLIRQFRIGAHLSLGKGDMIEIVAGLVDEGESFEEAARRETIEETGLAPYAMTEICRFVPTPSVTDEFTTLYLGLADSSAMADRAGHEEHEDIMPFTIAPQDAVAALDAGQVHNAYAIIALGWFARHGRERAKQIARKAGEG